MALERKTIRISVNTTSSDFEQDLTAAIEAQAPVAEGWEIEETFEMDTKRERLSLILIMTRQV